MAKKPLHKQIIDDNRMGARRALLEELFNDMYEDRRNIYIMNFVRGIMFGLGSVLGGTVLLALIVTILSQFVDWFPLLGHFVNGIIDAMNSSRSGQ
jgi:Domain of unknown function (DUF5665)